MYCPNCGVECEHKSGSLWGVSLHYCKECEETYTLTNEPGIPYTIQKNGVD